MVASSWWSNLNDWLQDEFLVIVMICSAAFLATRLVGVLARRQARKLARTRAAGSVLPSTTIAAHQEALVGAIRWAVNFTIVFVAIVWVLTKFNLPTSALVPLASVVGAGLGFGAQTIVGDVLAGIFILSERQFGVGDLIRIGPLMSVGWVEGRVEEMTLRVTKVRTFDGDLVTIANGELRQSVNASRDWARLLVTVPLSRDGDLEAVTERLNAIGAQMAGEEAWSEVMLEAPTVAGVDDLGSDVLDIRVTGRTMPAQQWRAARELRRRIALELRDLEGPVRVGSEKPPS